MDHVAFFRNVNQGQRGHPSTADLVAAFDAAGAPGATPFRSNGTVLFDADDPFRAIAGAAAWLDAGSVYHGTIFTRTVDFVAGLVDRHSTGGEAHRRELTIFAEEAEVADSLAALQAASDRRCAIIDHGPGWAVVENDADRQSNGTPTLEAILARPATSRGLPTLIALVDRFAV